MVCSPRWVIVQTWRRLPRFGLAGGMTVDSWGAGNICFCERHWFVTWEVTSLCILLKGFTWHTSPEQLESFGIWRMGRSGEGIEEQGD